MKHKRSRAAAGPTPHDAAPNFQTKVPSKERIKLRVEMDKSNSLRAIAEGVAAFVNVGQGPYGGTQLLTRDSPSWPGESESSSPKDSSPNETARTAMRIPRPDWRGSVVVMILLILPRRTESLRLRSNFLEQACRASS